METNTERIKFNIHGQRFELEKTSEINTFSHCEIHTISLCINNVKVYFSEWNIAL